MSNFLTLESINFQNSPVEEVSLYPSQNVSLAVSGTYENFKEYLRDLETTVRSMDVNTITFQVETSRRSQQLPELDNFLTYSLKIKVYYQ